MAKKIITRGTGITAKAIVQHSGDDMKPLMQQWVKRLNALAKNRNPFDARIAQTERWAKSVLKRAGLEANGVTDDHDDTRENYAQRFISEIRFVRVFIDRGEAAQAARFAVNLGALMGEAGMKFKWESHALRGEKFIGNKRGLSARSQKALEILQAKGASYSTKSVWRDLEAAGVVPKKTDVPKSFEITMTRLRKRIP